MTNKTLTPSDARQNKFTLSLSKTAHRYHDWLLLVAILAGSIFLQALLLPNLSLTYYEAVSLQVSRFINRGYEPYDQIFTMAHPLFVWLMGWLGRFDLSPTGFKLTFLLFGLLLLANTFIIARVLLGRMVALATIFLLATAATFIAEAATAIVAVLPALSIATLSLVFTLRYLVTKQRFWLFLGGVVWSIALFFSEAVLSIAIMHVIFIIFFEVGTADPVKLTLTGSNFYKAIGIWLLGAFIALALGIVLASPEIIFDHILNDQLTIREKLPPAFENNFRLIGLFATYNLWLFLFAVYGITRIYSESNHPLWVALVWSLLSFCWLMLQTSVRLVDVAILLPPLAIMAGWGAIDFASRVTFWSRTWQANHPRQRLFQVGLGCLLMGIYFWGSWQQLNRFNLKDINTEDDLRQLAQQPEVISFVQHHTAPNDCVIIDDPALSILADRLPTPKLVELSSERLASGLITQEAVKSLAQGHDCKAVIFSQREYTRPLADFREWASSYYPNEGDFIRTTVYYQ